ncbi:MAG: aspartate dehydrogenase [Burkholderiales bacterium]|nr:aspartate dehydrogenase [Burkholderiales bacterium]
MKQQSAPLRIGIAGAGAIGASLARALDRGIEGLALAAVAARDNAAARARLSLSREYVFTDFAGLARDCDVIVECAPAQLLPDIAHPALAAGRTLVILSAGALLRHMDLIDLARERGARIIVPTGALIGLDAVTAAAEGRIESVRMITRKPVKGLAGAPYLIEHGIAIEDIREPLCVFRGSARDAAAGFPANLNVAVALSLAGIGPDRTQLEIWADPAATRNNHRIEVDADAASFSMEIHNVPSENPRTGRITALSVLACLRKMTAPLRVGT